MTVFLAALLPLLLFAPPGDKVIDVRSSRGPAASSFDSLWSAYKKAEAKGDSEAAQNALREIRRLRIERNIRSLETMALARVEEGVTALRAGDNTARGDGVPRRGRVRPAPPRRVLRPGPARHEEGPARDRARGQEHDRRDRGAAQHRAWRPLSLRALRAGGAARPPRHHRRVRAGHADPLRVAPEARLRGVVRARAPIARPRPRRHHPVPARHALPGLGLAAALVAGHALHLHGARGAHRHAGPRRPLRRHRAGDPHDGGAAPRPAEPALLGEPGRAGERTGLARHRRCSRKPSARTRTIATSPTCSAPNTRRRVATTRRRASTGRRCARRRRIRSPSTTWPTSSSRRGEFPAAIARYKQGIESGPPAPVAATFYYNMSLAHLQRFEYQPAQEARTQAERLDSSLVHGYDSLWKYDKGDYAVVDLGLELGRGVVEVRGLARRHRPEEPIRPGARLRELARRCSPA